jgi:hypothetical protein
MLEDSPAAEYMPSAMRRAEQEVDQSFEQIQSLITNLRHINEEEKVTTAVDKIYNNKNLTRINQN